MSRANSKKAVCLRVEQWPTCDRAAWLEALKPANPFIRGGGRAAHLASSTQVMVANGYGRYLGWLQERGLLDPTASPGGRTSEQHLLAYLEHLQAANKPYTVAARLQQLGTAVKIMAPDANHKSILLASYRVASEARSTRNKRDRVQPCDRTASLGYDLVEKASSQSYLTPLMRAKMHRDGLLLLLLSYRGLRRKNLAAIEIGRSLVLRGDEIWLVFEEKDMKGRRVHEQPLPHELKLHISRYIHEYRSVLLACTKKSLPPTNALWISSQGTQMTSAAIYYQVTSRTKEAFGAPMPPHFFRDSIATTQAIEGPRHANDVVAILGHTDIAISEKHYNQSNGVRVRSEYAEAVSKLQRKVRPVKSRGLGRQ